MSKSEIMYQRVLVETMPARVPARIDIIEPMTPSGEEGPLTITRGEPQVYRFRYISGDPPSYAFDMTWEAVGDDPPLTETFLVPSFEFQPKKPVEAPSFTAWQHGIVTITFPDDAPYDSIIGHIWICQEDLVVSTPIGDPKRQPLSPFDPNRRRDVIPNWEEA